MEPLPCREPHMKSSWLADQVVKLICIQRARSSVLATYNKCSTCSSFSIWKFTTVLWSILTKRDLHYELWSLLVNISCSDNNVCTVARVVRIVQYQLQRSSCTYWKDCYNHIIILALKWRCTVVVRCPQDYSTMGMHAWCGLVSGFTFDAYTYQGIDFWKEVVL